MKAFRWRLGFSLAAGVAVSAAAAVLLSRAVAESRQQAQRPPNRVPAANNLNAPAAAPANAPRLRDVGKGVIEMPTKKILAARTVAAPAAADARFVNPKVQPGKVRWHADFDAACRAAKQSGKPVLLFQMMGRLDDRFC